MNKFKQPRNIFPDRYYPSMTNRKAAKGGIQGVIASGIGIGLTAAMKMVVDVNDPVIENAIASISGVIAAGLSLGISNWLSNNRKHRSKKRG